MTVMDLLATLRRWRVHEPFVTGQTDGLSRALVACLNAGQPAPRWLRETVVEFLLEALWERPRQPAAREALRSERDALVRRWREQASGR